MKYCLLLLPLALAACSPAPTPEAASTPPAVTATVAATTEADATPTIETTLGQYHWQLHEATAADGSPITALLVRPQQPVQLDFVSGRLSVSNACNRINASYSIDKGQLNVGHLMQTMMACTDGGLMQLDAALNERLQGALKLSLHTDGDAPRLHLTTASGDSLLFTGKPTAATRFGSAGEQVFLEVAAQTVPCNHPLIPDQQCLQVRERHYDANGLRTGTPGEWQPLNQDIEGYTHEAGVRNVLRVQRYNVKNPPADASSIAYVLDMVVESEVAKP